MKAYLWGAAIGVLLGATNLVIGLTLGVGVSVAVTAVTLVAAARAASAGRWSAEEGVIVQSVASAAGFSTGSALASAVAAVMLASGAAPSLPLTIAWVGLSAWLGTSIGYAFRAALVERAQLPFPSGRAAAVVLESTAAGNDDARRTVRRMLGTGLVAAVITLLRDAVHLFPATLLLPGAGARWLLGVDLSPLAFGVGTLVGWRLAVGLLAGVVGILVGGPLLVPLGAEAGFGTIAGSLLWLGVGLMAGAGLCHFAVSLTSVRELTELGPKLLRPAVLLPALALAALGLFGLQLHWLTVLACLVLLPPLAVIAARVAGETDVTPPLGTVAQLASGRLSAVVTNIWAGGFVATATATCADALTDATTGHRLGVDAAVQARAQRVGVVVGALTMTPLFFLLATPETLGSKYPAPAAQLFLGLATALTGAEGLGSQGAWLLGGGVAVGVVLAALERKLPFMLSPVALGLACLIPPSMAVTFAAGGLVATALRRSKWNDALGSGLLAGEGLVAAALACWQAVAKL